MSNLTPEQQNLAMLKLMAKQVELLEAIDWKLWQLHQKYMGTGDSTPDGSNDGMPSIDRIERL